MIRGDECGFFAGSHVVLGNMANPEYSHQPCIIKEFVRDKQLWKVKILDPTLEGQGLLVKEKLMMFDWYAAPPERLAKLPAYLRVSRVADAGNALFCDKDVQEGVEILDEPPLMVVTNKNAMLARWKLFREMRRELGPKAPALVALDEFTDGGITGDYMDDASTLLRRDAAATSEEPAVSLTEVRQLAGVLARWQSNSLSVSAVTPGQSQSALFRYACKANHSCDANCVTIFDMETGNMILRTNRAIRSGEQLTISYFGADPDFMVLSVKERRKQLSKRDFVCCCSRCVREGGEMPQSMLPQLKEKLARDVEKQRLKMEEKKRRQEEKERARQEQERTRSRRRSSNRNSSSKRQSSTKRCSSSKRTTGLRVEL
eukprot:gb/GFBE01055011.1/.p1 GENE.gb/GFBE01055011.1/~~gb/GFBE01055011.1/.p1  ORF type:complete len:373 (+),score=84.44 gb/GFBE01055011.1/:1-1119(+)